MRGASAGSMGLEMIWGGRIDGSQPPVDSPIPCGLATGGFPHWVSSVGGAPAVTCSVQHAPASTSGHFFWATVEEELQPKSRVALQCCALRCPSNVLLALHLTDCWARVALEGSDHR